MDIHEIKLEKRVLPLLDIALILIGILILVMGTPQLGEDKVFQIQADKRILQYNEVVIFDGKEFISQNVEQVLHRAISGGFHNIEIRNTGEDNYSAGEMLNMEKHLLQTAQELYPNHSLTIRYIPQ